jgi:hypothetical protein
VRASRDGDRGVGEGHRAHTSSWMLGPGPGGARSRALGLRGAAGRGSRRREARDHQGTVFSPVNANDR